jgi:hypothetical protein
LTIGWLAIRWLALIHGIALAVGRLAVVAGFALAVVAGFALAVVELPLA